MATIERTVRDARKPSFQVLERTFAILDIFDEERAEWSTTEIARSLGLPIPTVHRILTALKRRGYVSQHDETKRFRLGVAALQLGDRARAVVDLRSVAIPSLRSLSRDTGETALLTVLAPRRDRGVCLERVETAHPLRLSVTPGRQLPLHAGASQKALLAYMGDDEVEGVIAGGLERVCHATITDAHVLREELSTIRRRGWASSLEETNVGVWGIAVPVLSAHSEIVCAVGIAGPSARLTTERVRQDVCRVHAAARAIGRALRFSVPELSATRSSIKPRARRSNGQTNGQTSGETAGETGGQTSQGKRA
jgi:IclR family transcriptional regulator, acetate operon repressor